MSRPKIDGVHAAICTVSEFGPHEALFCGALDWHLGTKIHLTAAETAARFHMDTESEVVQLVARGATSGEIWLVRFADSSPQRLGHPPIRVNGLFAIDLYVRDIDEAVARIERTGARCVGKATWQIATPGGNVTVRQGKIDGPDDVCLVIVNPDTPRYTATWSREPDAFATELSSVVVGSPDLDASKAFWGPDGLGLPIVYDSVFSQPEMSRMCGIEDDSAFRMAFGVGATTARLEIVGRAEDPHAATASAELAAGQRPGRSLGQSAWVVLVNGLEPTIEMSVARGASVIRPAARQRSLAGRDEAERCAAIRTPEGIWLELLERA